MRPDYGLGTVVVVLALVVFVTAVVAGFLLPLLGQITTGLAGILP